MSMTLYLITFSMVKLGSGASVCDAWSTLIVVAAVG